MVERNDKIYNDWNDVRLSRPIVWYFILTAICVFGRQSILSFLPIPEQIYSIIRYGVTLGLFILALPKIKKRFHVWFFGLEVFFGLSYVFAYLRGHMLAENIATYCITTLVICIPALVSIASIENYNILYTKMLYGSFPIAAIVMISMFSTASTGLYSMSGSYQLVLTGAIHYNEVFRSKKLKWLYLILTGIELVAIFVRGARGPLLCIIVFIAIKTISQFRINGRTLVFSSFGGIALLLAILNISTIMNWIGTRLNEAGLYSRTFQYILDNSLFNDSGRSIFRERAIELIQERPIIGYSISSDVKLLGGQYAHSFPIELIFNFGIFVGGLFFLYITYHVIHSFFVPDGTERDLRMIFLPQGYLMLFFSGTYLQNVYLFLFLGIAISSMYESKVRVVFFPEGERL